MSDGYRDSWGGVYYLIRDYVLKDMEDMDERAHTAMDLHTQVRKYSATALHKLLSIHRSTARIVYMVYALDAPQGFELQASHALRYGWQAIYAGQRTAHNDQAPSGKQGLSEDPLQVHRTRAEGDGQTCSISKVCDFNRSGATSA